MPHPQDEPQVSRKFVVEFIDPATACISSESYFETDDLAALCSIVDPGATHIQLAAVYELGPVEIAGLHARFALVCEEGCVAARLRSTRPVDDLPYKIHTNRELALMLAGSKPLAAFFEYYPCDPHYELIPERMFEPHLEAGVFTKREYVQLNHGKSSTRIVLYARQNEEWRIDAYILMLKTALQSGWNEGFERMQGSLLGYEDWQNDIYIETIYRAKGAN